MDAVRADALLPGEGRRQPRREGGAKGEEKGGGGRGRTEHRLGESKRVMAIK